MNALWLEDGALSLRDVPMPDAAGAGEALIRVRHYGRCYKHGPSPQKFCPITRWMLGVQPVVNWV